MGNCRFYIVSKSSSSYQIRLSAQSRWFVCCRAVLVCCLVAACESRPSSTVQPLPEFRSAHSQASLEYHRDVKPILRARCAVCHSCNDAPCQLKLTSFEGLARGASKAQVYRGSRLRQATPTRLGLDAQSVQRWRNLGFFPVLERPTGEAVQALSGSLLYRMLALKDEHPQSHTLP